MRGILGFFGERIFGPRRRELLEEDLRASVKDMDEERGRRIAKLRRAVERIEAQQARQVRNLERDDDPEGVMFRHIRERLNELEEERGVKLEQLRGLEAEEHQRNGQAQAVELLEALPVLPTGLLEAPEEILRRMFEWFQLQVRYDRQTNQAHVRVAISEETLDQVLSEGASLMGGVRGGNVEGSHRAHVFGAPGSVWFHDIVHTCLETSFTPRSREVGRVVGTSGGHRRQGGRAVEDPGRQGLRALQAVGA